MSYGNQNSDSSLKRFITEIQDPVNFANYLRSPMNPTEPFRPYDYQIKVLKTKNNKIVLRFGRQTGKTVTLCWYLAWWAMKNRNQRVVVITPMQNHMDVIWELFLRMTKDTPIENFITGIKNRAPHRIKFKNNSQIVGLIAGPTGKSVKGRGVNLMVLDECFSKDTKIDTLERGTIPVHALRPKEHVLTITTEKDLSKVNDVFYGMNLATFGNEYNPVNEYEIKKARSFIDPLHYTRVKKVVNTGKKKVYMYITETGRKIKLTPEHPVLVKDNNNRGRVVPIMYAHKYGGELGFHTSYPAHKKLANIKHHKRKKYVAAAIYGVLFSGHLPRDHAILEQQMDSLAFAKPEMIPFMEKDKISKYTPEPRDSVFPPVKPPDWIFEDKDYSTAFLAGFFGSFKDRIPNKFHITLPEKPADINDLEDTLKNEETKKETAPVVIERDYTPYLKKALKYHKELYIEDGNIHPSSLIYFHDNIGYMFNERANEDLAWVVEYYKSGSNEPIDDWAASRVSASSRIATPIVFEKIVKIIPIGIMDTYSVQTENSYLIANDFIVHNCDFLTEKAWGEILPIMTSCPDAQLILSSTPSGAREYFWKTFHDPELGFMPEDPNLYNTEYDGRHYVSSYQAPHWTDKLERFYRKSFTEDEYTHQILAEFGELGGGVFNQKAINNMFINKTYNEINKVFGGLTLMGIDWNGKGIGVVITIIRKVSIPYDLEFISNAIVAHGGGEKASLKEDIHTYFRNIKDGFVIVYRETVKDDPDDVTSALQTNAVNRIKKLRYAFNVNAIYGDKGWGDMQFEQLHILGETLDDPVLRYAYGIEGQKSFDFIDPVTGEKTKKIAKHLYVNMLAKLINSSKLYCSFDDDHQNSKSKRYGDKESLSYELSNFVIEKWNSNGQPIYSADYDHIIAAIGYLFLGYLIDWDPTYISKSIAPELGGNNGFRIEEPDRMSASSILVNFYNKNRNSMEASGYGDDFISGSMYGKIHNGGRIIKRRMDDDDRLSPIVSRNRPYGKTSRRSTAANNGHVLRRSSGRSRFNRNISQ